MALLLLLLSRGASSAGPQKGFKDTYRATDICGEADLQGPTTFTGCATILLLATVLFSWNPSYDNLVCGAYSDDIDLGNMMVIFVRSTISKYEGMIDFDYAFTDPDKVDPRLEGMGGIHAGFSKLALQVFDELQPILEEQVVKGPINHVSISAYSRGAGTSTILSYLVQQYINEAIPGLNLIQVDALLFAPPNAGIQKAQPGGINFGADIMPYQSDSWRCLETMDTKQAFGFLSATHSCSYLCAFSSFVNITNNRCLLRIEGADLSVASFCTTYPHTFPNACFSPLAEP
eukprot:gene1393-32762_t